jgi:hypothetical protein
MKLNLRAFFLSPVFQDMEDGRQGMAGNGHTSRVWKGDGIIRAADISNTGIGLFVI